MHYQNFGNMAFGAVLILTALVLLITALGASGNRKDWEQSLAAVSQAQQAVADGDYERALAYYEAMSPGYQASHTPQLIVGSAYVGMADQAKAAGQAEASKEYLQLAALHLNQAREKNFHIVESQGYVNGYARVMVELGEYAAARQYFLQSVKLNTNPEFTTYAQEQLKLIEGMPNGGGAGE